jgi:biotin operon repressor
MIQADLFAPRQKFSGKTFSEKHDGARLERQLDRVRKLMEDGIYRTLAEIKSKAGGSETAVSARLRDLRKEGRTVLSERKSGGLWHYRLVPRVHPPDSEGVEG